MRDAGKLQMVRREEVKGISNMEYIKTENNEGLLIVKMARGKANALNTAMVEELNAALDHAASDENVRGVVLASDRPKVFSGGFDVLEVFAYDRETMTEFFGRFIDLYEGMMRLPKPVVAAVNGHAFAGGAVMALAADKRVMAEGDFGFALNEINLGLVLPSGMIRMAVSAVGATNAREIALEGKTISPARALEMGLASELASPETVLDRAINQAREMADKPPLTFAAIKKAFVEVSNLIPPGGDRKALSPFIEHWFSPESSQHRQRLIESMRR
jgi:enoyl-CoA hydratase/carnithine racemase